MADSTGSEKNIQGWWTWVVPLFVFQGATQLSLLSMVSTGICFLYAGAVWPLFDLLVGPKNFAGILFKRNLECRPLGIV